MIYQLLFVSIALTLSLLSKELTLCLTPTDRPSMIVKKFYPIAGYIERHIGKKVAIKIPATYETLIDDIVEGQCDLSRVGPAAFVLAKRKNAHLRLLAMEEKEGKKHFYGGIITAKDSKIRSLHDLVGKTFAFGSPNSTIGRYLSQARLRQAGITANTLKGYKYLGRHDKVAFAVAVKLYDAGAVKASTYEKYKHKGLRLLATFPVVTKPWVVSQRVDPQLFNQLQRVLLGLKEKRLLKVLDISGFAKTTEEAYRTIGEKIDQSRQF